MKTAHALLALLIKFFSNLYRHSIAHSKSGLKMLCNIIRRLFAFSNSLDKKSHFPSSSAGIEEILNVSPSSQPSIVHQDEARVTSSSNTQLDNPTLGVYLTNVKETGQYIPHGPPTDMKSVISSVRHLNAYFAYKY